MRYNINYGYKNEQKPNFFVFDVASDKLNEEFYLNKLALQNLTPILARLRC
jgi:hypothetical protein